MIVADAMRRSEGTLALDLRQSRVIGSPRTGAERFDAWLRLLDEPERLRAFCICSRVIRSAMDQGASPIVDDWTWYDFWTVCALHVAAFHPEVLGHVAATEAAS